MAFLFTSTTALYVHRSSSSSRFYRRASPRRLTPSLAFLTRLISLSNIPTPNCCRLTMKSASSNSTSSFGDYFADCFARRFPQISSMLQRDQTVFMGNVYLFRFDKNLSFDFVHGNIDAMSRSIADISGKSVAEARRLFTSSARDAARSYFADGWGHVSDFVENNSSSLIDLQRKNSRHVALIQCLRSNEPAPEVDPILLQTLFENAHPVVVFVYAKYCSLCRAIRPLFEQVARGQHGNATLVSLNGPKFPEFKNLYSVTSYPAILRFVDQHTPPVHFPRTHQPTFDNIIAFARGTSLHIEPNGVASSCDPDESDDSLDALDSPRRNRVFQWAPMLKRQGIDELDVLISERKHVMDSKIDMAVQCGEFSCDILPHRSHHVEKGDPPPLCVLLGGGMGAGKTTAVGLIGATSFWKKYGEGVVVVEADAFKLSDPLFQVLQSVTPLASRIVHRDSIVAAEQLFLKAVNSRRDVVFDGTLSWSEYAKQTIDMLRDTEYYYERGPGYVEQENGIVMEQYWARSEKRQKPAVAYRVELVGVTAEADISVMRGIVRRITTGRGVPVRDQLKSHALFSQYFERYVDMVDSAYLFDTTIPTLPEEEKQDYAKQLVAIKPGIVFDTPEDVVQRPSRGDIPNGADNASPQFVVRLVDAYARFLRKKRLNTEANRASDLFITSAVER